jgi:tRNA-dihydrouridine synthase C
VVHARTKLEGYKPPAHWHAVARIQEAVAVPVIANGEVWTVGDALQARRESHCSGLMLGRGAVADPGLALALRAHDRQQPALPTRWPELGPALLSYWARVQAVVQTKHQAGRVKQWLHYLRRTHPQAQSAYEQLRTIGDAQLFDQALHALVDGMLVKPDVS